MFGAATWGWLGTLFLAGLLGSLHCVGMCGPILVAFSRLLPGHDTSPSDSGSKDARRSLGWEFGLYHCGRLWTYGFLGFLAGWLGAELRFGAQRWQLQRPVSLALAAAVLVCGLIAWRGAPAWVQRFPGRQTALGASCQQLVGRHGLLAGWLRAPQSAGRFLVGLVMGFLPCAMTYGALAVATTLPTPVHGALGMLSFGLGTVPALSLVLMVSPTLGRSLAIRLQSSYAWWAARGPSGAAVLMISVGLFMLWRAWNGGETAAHGHGMH